MYDIIDTIISHAWESNYSSDQQYIYYICGALIVVLTAVFVDRIFLFFNRLIGGRK